MSKVTCMESDKETSVGETVYDDKCAWCGHEIKVYTLSWQKVKSFDSMPLVANYCNSIHRDDDDGDFDCEETALSTPENTEKVLHEIVRRRRKLERLEAEAETALHEAS